MPAKRPEPYVKPTDGSFSKPIYVISGEKYKEPKNIFLSGAKQKKKNFVAGRPVESFSKFTTLAVGEKWTDRPKKEKKHFLHGDLKNPGVPAKASGKGSAYGTFHPPPEHFSPKTVPVKKERAGKQFGLIRPQTAVDGSTFQKEYPKHMKEDYDAKLKQDRKDARESKKKNRGGPIRVGSGGMIFDEKVWMGAGGAKTKPVPKRPKSSKAVFRGATPCKSGRDGNFTPVPKYHPEKYTAPISNISSRDTKPPKNKPVLHTMSPVYTGPVREIRFGFED